MKESVQQQELLENTVKESKSEQRAALVEASKARLPAEPSDSEPKDQITQVVFRTPGSGARITRLFRKTDSLQTLYDFVRTCDPDEQLGFEEEESAFVLMQPMPKKEFEDCAETTLDSVGLHPRAMLQIMEKREEE